MELCKNIWKQAGRRLVAPHPPVPAIPKTSGLPGGRGQERGSLRGDPAAAQHLGCLLEPGCPRPALIPALYPGLAGRAGGWISFVFFQGQVLDTGIPLVLSVCPPAHWSLPGTKDCANVLMASG